MNSKRTAPIQPGDAIAAGLRDGTCPVGVVAATDDQFVSIQLVSFGTGMQMSEAVVVRRDDIARAKVQYEDDFEDGVFDLDLLGDWQQEWFHEYAARALPFGPWLVGQAQRRDTIGDVGRDYAARLRQGGKRARVPADLKPGRGRSWQDAVDIAASEWREEAQA